MRERGTTAWEKFVKRLLSCRRELANREAEREPGTAITGVITRPVTPSVIIRGLTVTIRLSTVTVGGSIVAAIRVALGLIRRPVVPATVTVGWVCRIRWIDRSIYDWSRIDDHILSRGGFREPEHPETDGQSPHEAFHGELLDETSRSDSTNRPTQRRNEVVPKDCAKIAEFPRVVLPVAMFEWKLKPTDGRP